MADVNPRVPLVQFPFSAGIDESTRAEVVEAGASWLVLENGRQDNRGGYSTRNGFAAMANGRTDATTPSVGYRLIADSTAALRICDNQIEAFSSAAGAWKQLGRLPECAARLVDLPTMGVTGLLEDIDATNGYLAVSWVGITSGVAGAAYAAIIDQATGAVVRQPEVVSSVASASPALLAVQGNYFIAVRYNATGTKLEAWYLDTTSAATIATGWVAFAASLCTDATTIYVVHSLPSASTPRVAVLYASTGVGTNRATLLTVNVSGVVETLTINTSSVTPNTVACGGNSTDTLWCTWNENTNVKVLGLSPFAITTTALASTSTVVTTGTNTNYSAICASSTTGKARLWASDTSTQVGLMRGVKTTAGAAATDGAQVSVRASRMICKPFFYGGRYYSAFYGGSVNANEQRSFIVCDWTEDVTFLRPIANMAPSLASSSSANRGKFVASTASTAKYFVGLGVRRSGLTDGAAYTELDFNSSLRWRSVAHGNSTYLSGGLLSYCDGVRVAEAGFLYRPDPPGATVAGTGITGTYRYVAVYEEVDADGNWNVSGVSDPSGSVAPANQTVTVTTSPLTITARMSAAGSAARSVRVAWYRTATGGVAPYYRLDTSTNDTTLTAISYADSTLDATLIARAKLYSQPGVIGTSQDRRAPPGLSMLVSYNGMLVGASGSDVWYSGQNVSGEGVWFNPIFQVPIPGDGDVSAIWVQDGTLVVAKRREIYTLSGEAPSDNGSSGGLGLPRRLAADVGCIESRSPCVTALGTFFQSDRGIELLTRSQTVEWIGEFVQETLASYPVVTSATVEPVSTCVLIELAASESSGVVSGSGRTLVYDLSLRSWVSTDRRTSSAGTADAPSQAACMIYTGSAYRYAWLSSAGVVHYETPGVCLDANGTMVCKRAISANVKVAGMQGLQHVNRTLLLARYHTPHDLNVSFAYDYSSTFKTPRLYTAAQLVTLTAAIPNMQLEHGMHDDARCQAVRVQLQDVTPSSGTLGTGQGATWIGLCFESVPATGAYKLPDESR